MKKTYIVIVTDPEDLVRGVRHAESRFRFDDDPAAASECSANALLHGFLVTVHTVRMKEPVLVS